ncbi:hypothetical protein EVJ50_14215 [Synechococcus sp. RSCCF101]|nr:hypothetical protein EVJ50_14215 [Synechococcus sp. RSCCF101]
MPWWVTFTLLSSAAVLWSLGSANRDDVIGLLEQMIAIALLLVVIFFGHQLPLELTALVIALRLPRARTAASVPVTRPMQGRRDVLIPF